MSTSHITAMLYYFRNSTVISRWQNNNRIYRAIINIYSHMNSVHYLKLRCIATVHACCSHVTLKSETEDQSCLRINIMLTYYFRDLQLAICREI